MDDTVLYEVDERIATITLNRPEALNAINRQLYIDLSNAIRRFDEDDDAWVAIVTGAGRAFCVGLDLKEQSQRDSSGGQADAADFPPTDRLMTWPRTWKPLIAAIDGYALAGGWYIAQVCDLRVASEDAKLGINEPRVGVLPFFAGELTRMIPEAAVMELVLTSEHIPSRRALEMGFLNQVVPAAQLMAAARDIAATILRNAPVAVRAFKELVVRSRELSASEAADLALDLYKRALATEDAREGPRAFAEKRPPMWRGR